MSISDIEDTLLHKENLESFLYKNGVPKAAIDKSKQEIINKEPDFRLYTEYIKRMNKKQKVYLKEVCCPAREFNHNTTWFNVLKWAIYGYPKGHRVSMNINSTYSLLSLLEDYKYQKLKRYYETDNGSFSLFSFIKIQDDSEVNKFIQVSDGNHRLILAKIIGVEYVYADKIDVYIINQQKKDVYDQIKHKEAEIMEYVANSKLFFFNDKFQISIYCKKGYSLTIYEPFLKIQEGNLDVMKKYLELLKLTFLELKQLETDTLEKHHLYKYIPDSIYNIIKKRIKKHRGLISTNTTYNEIKRITRLYYFAK